MEEKHEKYCECLDCTDFVASASTYGLKLHEFSHLSGDDSKKLVRLIARISERSYRRGVQQTITLYRKNSILPQIIDNLYDYRYENDLDNSYGLDGLKTTSLERLDMEESLREIGLI